MVQSLSSCLEVMRQAWRLVSSSCLGGCASTQQTRDLNGTVTHAMTSLSKDSGDYT